MLQLDGRSLLSRTYSGRPYKIETKAVSEAFLIPHGKIGGGDTGSQKYTDALKMSKK